MGFRPTIIIRTTHGYYQQEMAYKIVLIDVLLYEVIATPTCYSFFLQCLQKFRNY